MYAGAEFAAQVGRIRDALRPLALAVEALGSGQAADAIVDAHDGKVLLGMARDLQGLALTLQDMAAKALEVKDEEDEEC